MYSRKYKKYKRNKDKRPNVGDHVKIIIKPYHQNNTKEGIIQRVLTRKMFHSRGHKVKLTDGTVGRMLINYSSIK